MAYLTSQNGPLARACIYGFPRGFTAVLAQDRSNGVPKWVPNGLSQGPVLGRIWAPEWALLGATCWITMRFYWSTGQTRVSRRCSGARQKVFRWSQNGPYLGPYLGPIWPAHGPFCRLG